LPLWLSKQFEKAAGSQGGVAFHSAQKSNGAKKAINLSDNTPTLRDVTLKKSRKWTKKSSNFISIQP